MNPEVLSVQIMTPSAPMQSFVDHYWLSRNNSDQTYMVSPDGAVDIVIVISPSQFSVDAYGSSTNRSEVPLSIGKHYLGIRFRPGQHRFFLDAKSSELTNATQTVEAAFLPNMSDLAESIANGSTGIYIDEVLLKFLIRHPARQSRIDKVIQFAECALYPQQVSELAQQYCKSTRQFERAFVDAVGLPPKLFTQIIRFRRATKLLANSNISIAQIAAVLGYADQSHMTREFVRFCGQPPSKARQDVAFVQDHQSVVVQDEGPANNRGLSQ